MGGDASKIAKEAGITEKAAKEQLEEFKKLVGPKATKDTTLSKTQYVAHSSSEKAASAFDAYCPQGKMGGREFVLANLAVKGHKPPTKPGAGRTVGSGPGTAGPELSPEEERARRAAAAESRLQGAAMRGRGNNDTAAGAQSEEERKKAARKQEKLGRVRALLQILGETEPFGLASMPPEKLNNYHSHLEQRVESKKEG
ncbi:hypothetical protein DIPPA_22025 [Diplonema papillatum]|nr:hypothetical protein DIPPA_22025 [Diplonema papillatum]|eukprot:gene12570-19469_t